MVEKDKVSIITASHNNKVFILDTFNSVINQTYPYWEWIIVDDCSNDGSFEYVKNLIANEKRIKLFRLSKNSGSAVARNEGLRNATGKYITFLDSDDLLDSDYLKKQVEFIAINGPIVSSGYRRLTDKSCTDFYVPDSVTYKQILCGDPLSCLTTMYDKEVIGDRFFPEGLKKREDYVFFLNILRDGYVARGNHVVLATYKIHKGSKTSNKFKLIKYQFYVYHKTQKINWFKSWYYVFRWACYGLKKYRNVK